MYMFACAKAPALLCVGLTHRDAYTLRALRFDYERSSVYDCWDLHHHTMPKERRIRRCRHG